MSRQPAAALPIGAKGKGGPGRGRRYRRGGTLGEPEGGGRDRRGGGAGPLITQRHGAVEECGTGAGGAEVGGGQVGGK